jgi:hypothetical protein
MVYFGNGDAFTTRADWLTVRPMHRIPSDPTPTAQMLRARLLLAAENLHRLSSAADRLDGAQRIAAAECLNDHAVPLILLLTDQHGSDVA